MMSNVCPKCGAKAVGRASNGIVYDCFSGHLDGEWTDGVPCLRSQLAQANARIATLLSERMDEAEAKVGTRPAHVVVEELEQALRQLIDAGRSALALRPPDAWGNMYPLSSSDMGELEDAIEAALKVLGGDENDETD